MHHTETGYTGLLYGGANWCPPAPVSAPIPPTTLPSPLRLAYRFVDGQILRYDVDFSWQVDGLGLHEYIEGEARVALQGTPSEDGAFVLRCTTDSVSERRASPKAPPFSKRTRAQIVLASDGSVRGMKWNGMVVPFRAPFWLCFPEAGSPISGAWARDIELGLPLLEKLSCPVDYSLASVGSSDTLVVSLQGDRGDPDGSVRLRGEVTFSRSRGCALQTRLSVTMKGRTDIVTMVRTRLVEEVPVVEEEEAFLYIPRPIVKRAS